MNHKAVSDNHKKLSQTSSLIALKLAEIEKLKDVVLASEMNDDRQLDLSVLTKLKNMLNVINLHTASIVNDLNELQIADGVYRENEFTARVSQAIEGVLDMMGPHAEQIFSWSMGLMKDKYKVDLESRYDRTKEQSINLENGLDEELSPLSHPNYTPLRPH